MAVSKRLRYEVFRRDNHTCRYCGGTPPDVKLTVDHVTPVALGGSDEPTNLVTACRDCNAGKSSSNPDAPLVDDVSQEAVRWLTATRQAGHVLQAQFREEQEYVEAVDQAWLQWTYADDSHVPRDDDWETSIRTFRRYGLPLDVTLSLVRNAMTTKGVRNEWRYFCKSCWTQIDELQRVAQEIADGTDEVPW